MDGKLSITFMCLGIMMIFIANNAHAMRADDGSLISVGDSIGKVESSTKGDSESYQVKNANADIMKMYIKRDGMNHELIFIDGKLTEINDNRE